MPGKNKQNKLADILRQMGKVLIAFSGGVDSTLLVYMAQKVLPGNILAVTAVSETYPARELRDARVLARKIGVKHLVIKTLELKNKDFTANNTERCYYCKKELFSKLQQLASKYKLNYVADAANIDDLQDYRPGSRAGQELGVRHPLQEAGFTKQDVRYLSRLSGLPTWDKSAQACLASRVPYGHKINTVTLRKIEQAEEFLGKYELKQVRVRDYGVLARIEVDPLDFPTILKNRERIIKYYKKLGYLYVSLDLFGYRMGSLNETLKSVRGSRVKIK